MLAGSGPQVAGRQQPPAASPAASGGGGGGGGEGPQPEWPAPEEMGSEGRAGEGPGGEVTDELILDIIQGVLSQVRMLRVWWVARTAWALLLGTDWKNERVAQLLCKDCHPLNRYHALAAKRTA